jgi:hypothetical protein
VGFESAAACLPGARELARTRGADRSWAAGRKLSIAAAKIVYAHYLQSLDMELELAPEDRDGIQVHPTQIGAVARSARPVIVRFGPRLPPADGAARVLQAVGNAR